MPYADPERQRRYQREWVAKRRRIWLTKNGPCVRCGSAKNLQVDHIDRLQKVDHKVWSWSAKKRESELAKCQVLCSDCHVKKGLEAGDIPPRVAHGDRKMYERHGCRCQACRVAHTRFQAAWRQKRLSEAMQRKEETQ